MTLVPGATRRCCFGVVSQVYCSYNKQVKQNATLDSSFWINAHRSGLLSVVMERFRLHYTPAVAAELLKEFPSGREFWKLVREEALFEVVPGLGQVTEFGLGERAAMNLALEHRDWLLLIDDQRPFQEAVRLSLRALCTPVLVVQLYVEGRLDARQALEALARLAVLQTVSPALLAAALAQLGVAWKEKR
jgi:hypothetical protein